MSFPQSRYLSFFFLCLLTRFGFVCTYSQTVDEGARFDFYLREVVSQQQAPPLTYVREDDVVWEHCIWRTINFREKFNQFFFFPTEPEGVQGRRCLARVIWDAVVADEIPIFEDDEFRIPLDNADFVSRYTKADTVVLEIADEDDTYEYQTILVPKEFQSEDILQIRLKEVWYIDKASSRLHVRPLGLALTKDYYKDIQGEREFMGTIDLFWIPLLSTAVRNLLIRNEAYYEDNLAHLPTWYYIFDARVFDSYITRETNRFNRSIGSYLSGPDAILESDRIEQFLLNISEDMWEY